MKNKRGILYWLKVIVAVLMIFILMYRCSRDYSIPAFAAPNPPTSSYVDLTPQQTVALYGTQLNALYYDFFVQHQSYSITFDYAFALNDIGYMSDGGGFDSSNITSTIGISGSDMTESAIKNLIGSMNGIVYVADATQWGNTQIYPYSSSSDPAHVQLHVPFSVDLSGIGRIQQGFFYSTKHGAEQSWIYVYLRNGC